MQTRLSSLTETLLNVGSGFLVTLAVWQLIVAPIWGYDVTIWDNLSMTAVFTVVSMLRGYVWRRLFNWYVEGR